jgi:hypothetical protein
MHLGMYVDETCNVALRLERAIPHTHRATEPDTNIQFIQKLVMGCGLNTPLPVPLGIELGES